MGEFLYTYRPGDDVCTPFKTDDPAIAAGLYADENGPGQVFVVVGDRLEEYDVDGNDWNVWRIDPVGAHRAPVGWERTENTWKRSSGWAPVSVSAERVDGGVVSTVTLSGRHLFGPNTLEVAVDRAATAETEAVLRMAAHVAWGGREVGEVRP